MTSTRPQKEPFDALAKVAVIGDTSVGKTNLLLRFVSTDYHMSHISTIGIDFKVKSIQLDNFKLKMQIWDTAGQQRYRNLTGTVYQGAHAIMLVYAVTDRKTFENVDRWMTDVKNHAPDNTIVAIVGNKIDMETDRVVKTEEGAALAGKYSAIFMETSAKENINVERIFNEVANRIKNGFFANKKVKKQEKEPNKNGKKKDTPQEAKNSKKISSQQEASNAQSNQERVKLSNEKFGKKSKKGCC